MKKENNVLVTGDVIYDHHIYSGERLVPDAGSPVGSQEQRKEGGAYLLYRILQNISKKIATKTAEMEKKAREKGKDGISQKVYSVKFGLEEKIGKLPAHQHAYALWKPCPAGKDALVWRMVQPLGYGDLDKGVPAYSKNTRLEKEAQINILVIDDGALGFQNRKNRAAWCIDGKEKDVDWVVYKMSSPVAQGDLWRELADRFSEKLIVLVSIDDVRREEVRISKGISWEQTALDLVEELNTNPNISGLLQSRHLIINYGSEGALHVTKDAAGKNMFRLIFDPGHMENEWLETFEGRGLGAMSCLTAGIVNHLAHQDNDDFLSEGIRTGLTAMRIMHENGHGCVGKGKIDFPYDVVTDTVVKGKLGDYAEVELPSLTKVGSPVMNSWTIMTAKTPAIDGKPLCGVGRQVALLGPSALSGVPYAKLGKLFTFDRNEIESFRTIRRLIKDYKENDKGKKPLSLAVFGPPGAGKSFGVVQVAEGVLGKNVPILEFNLSQFSGPEDLIGAFHQVRDKVLQGHTPVVFWDEFDSKEYEWLQYLLAPMQDGRFQEGQLSHPVGKCIFVFAGGTSYDMEHFGPDEEDKDDYKKFKLKKGPDFISRLSGYLNVLGPNHRQVFNEETKKWEDDLSDICFPIRRALLIRANLGKKDGQDIEIDSGLLSALIELGRYKHGARSLEKILSQIKQPDGSGLRRSDLPPDEVVSLHADYKEFIDITNRDLEFKTSAKELAPHIHEFYRELGRKENWLKPEMDKDFDALDADIKEDNIAAAKRIPQVLDLVGLHVVKVEGSSLEKTDDGVKGIIDKNLELLAEAEHNGWMRQKLANGWKYGEARNDKEKIHDCLVKYNKLKEVDKGKDRDSVTNFPEVCRIAGYKIV